MVLYIKFTHSHRFTGWQFWFPDILSPKSSFRSEDFILINTIYRLFSLFTLRNVRTTTGWFRFTGNSYQTKFVTISNIGLTCIHTFFCLCYLYPELWPITFSLKRKNGMKTTEWRAKMPHICGVIALHSRRYFVSPTDGNWKIYRLKIIPPLFWDGSFSP